MISNSGTVVKAQHKPSGFACLHICREPRFTGNVHVHSGLDCMDQFFEHLDQQDAYIADVLKNHMSMIPLTDRETSRYIAAVSCDSCRKAFKKINYKVHHHDHLTGHYIGPLCNNGNLQKKKVAQIYGMRLRPKKRREQ